jgi:hypothetical protein
MIVSSSSPDRSALVARLRAERVAASTGPIMEYAAALDRENVGRAFALGCSVAKFRTAWPASMLRALEDVLAMPEAAFALAEVA